MKKINGGKIMKKFFLIIVMLFLTSCLFAANVVSIKLGKFDIVAIKVQTMDHKKELTGIVFILFILYSFSH